MSDDDEDALVVHCYVEKIQGQLYAWEEESHTFLGQGPDRESLFERMYESLKYDGKVAFLCRFEPQQ